MKEDVKKVNYRQMAAFFCLIAMFWALQTIVLIFKQGGAPDFLVKGLLAGQGILFLGLIGVWLFWPKHLVATDDKRVG